MKKFIKFLIALLLAFVVVNYLYLFVLRNIDWEFKKTKEANSFRGEKLKVLVFGNSTAMDAINTEILTNKLGASYNFSVGGASLQTNYIQLKNYLQKNEKPQKVLLFLSSAHINYIKANDVNPIIDYYYSDSFRIGGLKDMPLFKFRWLFNENVKKLLSSDHRLAQVIRGQLRIKRIVPDNSTRIFDTVECRNNIFYNSRGYEYMWQMASLCTEMRIPIEIFEMPCWKQAQNNCPDIKLWRIIQATNLIISIHNLNNYNICDTLLDSKKDWLSMNHLNYYGSLKVTEEVIRVLLK